MKNKILFIFTIIIVILSSFGIAFAVDFTGYKDVFQIENSIFDAVGYSASGKKTDDGIRNDGKVKAANYDIYPTFNSTVTSVQSSLNSSPFNVLSTNRSVFCIKHNHPLHGDQTLERFHTNDVNLGTRFTLNWSSFNASASFTGSISGYSFDYFDQDDSELNTKRTLYSNMRFHYKATDLKSVNNTLDGKYYDLAYITTFSEKTGSPAYAYQTEVAQKSIWANTGDFNSGDTGPSYNDCITGALYKASVAFDEFEAQRIDHGTTLDFAPYKDAGAVYKDYSGTEYYQVGPFYMKDYTYVYCKDAEGYSGKELAIDKGLFGGIIDGSITMKDDSGANKTLNIDGVNVRIVYSGWSNMTYSNNSNTWIAGGTNEKDSGRSGTNWTAPTDSTYNASSTDGYIYPWPKSTFYIEIKRDKCRASETLTNLSFVYRDTTSSGDGWVFRSKILKHQVSVSDTGASTCTYNCQSCSRTGLAYSGSGYYVRSEVRNHYKLCSSTGYCYNGSNASSGKGNSGCSYRLSCTTPEHSHDSGCYSTDAEGNSSRTCGMSSHTHRNSCYRHTCSKPYCSHGYYNGNHASSTWGKTAGSRYCSGTTVCPTHSHTDCHTGNWVLKTSVEDGQPLLLVKNASVDMTLKKTSKDFSIRMTTDLSIDKYIVKVKHIGIAETTFDSVTARKNKPIADKEKDFLKVENGDEITFYIDLKNNQAQTVKYKISDIVTGSGYQKGTLVTQKSTNNGTSWTTLKTESLENSSPIVREDEITGNTIIRFILKYEVIEGNGLANNCAKICYRNNKDEDYVRTDKNRTTFKECPVINIAELSPKNKTEKVEDKDFYYVKSYNVPIDKYITEVKHANNVADQTYVRKPLTYNGRTYTDEEKFYDRDVINENMPTNVNTGTETNNFKKNNPVFLEYGDFITYRIDMQNTYYSDTGTRLDETKEPYYSPDAVRVTVTDKLPSCCDYTSLVIKYVYKNQDGVEQTYLLKKDQAVTIRDWRCTKDTNKKKYYINYAVTYTVNQATGDLIISNLPITEQTESYLELSFIVDTNKIGVLYENSASISDLKNINDVPANNLSERTSSSDYFYLNDYNVTLDKYITNINESILKNNIAAGFETGYSNEYYTNMKLSKDASGNITSQRQIAPDADVDENNKFREEHPVPVEKYETITYEIKVVNEAKRDESYIDKYPTKVRISEIDDYIEEGLRVESVNVATYTSKNVLKFKNVGSFTKTSQNVVINENDPDQKRTFVKWNLDIGRFEGSLDTILDPGDYMIYTVVVRIERSNMHLYVLENKAELAKLTNVNHGINNYEDFLKANYTNYKIENSFVKKIDRDVTTANIATHTYSSEFVRPKDLVISGRVWLDYNKDGYIGDINNSSEKGVITAGTDDRNYLVDGDNGNVTREKYMKGIEVVLYSITDDGTVTEEMRTITNESGLYTFAKDENGNWKKDLEQRVDKATGKDSKTKNYIRGSSEYIKYYVEFEYDGVLYKSTEVSSGNLNLEADGTISSDKKYLIDSNSEEHINAREEFNKKYETVSYERLYEMDSATDTGEKGDPEKTTSFDKNNHESYLDIDHSRTMTSRSFLHTFEKDVVYNAYTYAVYKCTLNGDWVNCWNHKKYWAVLIEYGLVDPNKYERTKDGRKDAQADLKNNYEEILKNSNAESTQITKYLWLYNYYPDTTVISPETEYLKYINLGLEQREKIDLSLKNDVYEVKTTVNGEEMTYSFDQFDVEDEFAINGEMPTSGKYLNDYIIKKPYGLNLYESDFKYRKDQYANKAVQDAKGEASELNIEITYKMTIDSAIIAIDEPLMKDKDRELDATIQEIMTAYDIGFEKYENNKTVTMKRKDSQDVLVDKTVKVAEAWYYPDNDVTKTKVNLTISNTSNYSYKNNNFTADGYNTLYIRGMDGVKIGEGENLDIYIKYVVDKDDEENMLRVLQILDEKEDINARGMENIAQINAYSVWYEKDGKPASIVDCNSNAGNLGNGNYFGVGTNPINVSVDDPSFYENSTYKTGIEFKVKNFTEKNISGSTVIPEINLTKTQIEAELQEIAELEAKIKCTHLDTMRGQIHSSGGSYFYYSDICSECFNTAHYGGHATLRFVYRKGLVDSDTYYPLSTLTSLLADYKAKLKDALENMDEELIRTISGKVWDDSRNLEEEQQYHGNGLYSTSDSKKTNARLNDNVTENYDNTATGETEQNDILVRSAKVEYIEIVPVREGGQIRYYEEALNTEGNDWNAIQNVRTAEDGTYTLKGFIPGFYLIRYTYGDDATNEDMLIFNGQDYKSTTYTGVSDSVKDNDTIIIGMEQPNKSDARDDEIRRLQSMAYSETMVSKKAEVLKGTKNDENSSIEFEELADNTYMEADTVRFYVKPEKLEKLTTEPGRDVSATEYAHLLKSSSDNFVYSNLFDILYNDIDVEDRSFSINNLDFGIEYRPESQISLSKAISGINLITSDGTTLVKLVLDTENFGQGSSQQNVIKEESIGLEYTQFVSNDYKSVDPYKLTSESYQGFVFINVDEEILQGSTIEIEYSFVAENNSEVDRVSKNLDDIRFRDNAATQANKEQIRYVRLDGDGTLYSDTDNDSNKYVYSATGTASQILYDLFYARDLNGQEYRKAVKTGYTSYYGKYLGKTYYTGTRAATDVVASIKFDKILDYVDTDLVFKTSTDEDSMWTVTTDDYLLGEHPTKGLFIKKELFTDNRLVNSKGVNYVTYKEDLKTPVTSNLVISVDDRRKDVDEYSINADPTVNKGISKYLQPYLTAGEASRGTIKIATSKVISAETSTDDMQYENLAEIIQYTSQTGRRTNYATTIGNASAATGEFASAMTELDTSATEVITLTPPTGLDRANRVIRDVVETTTKGIGFGVVGVALVFAGLVIVRFIIKKIKKRPIK